MKQKTAIIFFGYRKSDKFKFSYKFSRNGNGNPKPGAERQTGAALSLHRLLLFLHYNTAVMLANTRVFGHGYSKRHKLIRSRLKRHFSFFKRYPRADIFF